MEKLETAIQLMMRQQLVKLTGGEFYTVYNNHFLVLAAPGSKKPRRLAWPIYEPATLKARLEGNYPMVLEKLIKGDWVDKGHYEPPKGMTIIYV